MTRVRVGVVVVTGAGRDRERGSQFDTSTHTSGVSAAAVREP
jgi:hypothetical protein